MAVSFKIRIGYLLAEFLANAPILFGSGQTARAVTTGALETIFYSLHYVRVFIESNCHGISPFSFYYILPVNTQAFSG